MHHSFSIIRPSILIFVLFLLSTSSFAQSYQEVKDQYTLLYENEAYKKASEIGQQVLALAKKEFGDNSNEYLLALLDMASINDKIEAYEKALVYYDKGISKLEQLFPEELSSIAFLANSAGLVAFKSGNQEKSAQYFINALTKLKNANLTTTDNYAIYFDNLLLVIDQMPDNDEKLSYQSENADKILGMQGPNSVDYAYATNNLAITAMNIGRNEVAEENFNKALIAYSSTPESYLVVLKNLILLYEYMGLYDKKIASQKAYFDTLTKYDNASIEEIVVSSTILGNELLAGQNYDSADYYFHFPLTRYKDTNTSSLTYATVLHNYGWLKMIKGEYPTSAIYLNKVKILLETLNATEDILYSRVRNHLGELSLYMGDIGDETAENIDYALAQFAINPGNTSEDYISAAHNLGKFAVAISRYDLAEEFYTEAILLADTLGDNLIVENLYLDASKLYLKTGRFEMATFYLFEARKIDEVLFTENSLQYANYLTYQGAIQQFLGFYEESIQSLTQSYQLRSNLIGNKNALQTETLLNLGIAYLKNRDYEKAKITLEKSIKMQEDLDQEAYPGYKSTLSSLGYAYFYLENYKKAIDMSLVSLSLEDLDLSDLETATTLFNLATYYTVVEDYTLADEAFELTNAAYMYQIKTLFNSLSEQDKNNFFITRKGREDAFNSYAILRREQDPGISGSLYNNRLITKGLLLNSSKRVRKSILNSGDSAAIAQYNYWLYLKKEIDEGRANSMSEADLFEKQMIANEAEKILTKKAEKLLKEESTEAVTWQHIRDYLKPHEVAVELIRVGNYNFKKNSISNEEIYYVALIITPGLKSSPKMVVLKNGAALEGKFFTGYQNAIKYKALDNNSYSKFWQPIAQAIDDYEHVEKIYLSADGVYNKISLNTLLNSATGKYILDEVDIQQVTNTKDILQSKEASPTQNIKSALFGFPLYQLNEDPTSVVKNEFEKLKADTLSRFVRNGVITKLPGTKHEIETIGSLLKKNKIEVISYMNENADEARIKKLSSPYILHIATHGFFSPDANRYPWPFDIFMNAESSNPFSGSGLLLAGAQNTIDGQVLENGEDGILTAGEVMNLTLDNTDIVVLSACETGLGEIKNGEGVYGLQRAFQVAGAKSVVMSLWMVDDTATQKMMTYFYQNWLSGQTKREAFRNSQVSLRNEFPEPYYWGAFILLGQK